MSVEKIIEASGQEGRGEDREKQLIVLQFIKRLKTSPDRSKLYAELSGIFRQDREAGELIFDRLVHGDLPVMRHFALTFFEAEKAAELAPHVKRLVLIEDNLDNLRLCLRCAAGRLDRSELPEYFEAAAGGKNARDKEILAFLERECRRLSVDYSRMLENANAMRRQAREKRIEKYEKKKTRTGDEVVLADVVSAEVRNPRTFYFAAAAVALFLFLTIAVRVYGSIAEGRALGAALSLIDEYMEPAAIEKLSAASLDYPGSVGILSALHRIYCENYMIVEASDTLNRMLNLRIDSAVVRAAEIRNAMFSGDMKAASDFFSKAEADPSAPPEMEFLKIEFEYMNSRIQGACPPEECRRIFEEARRFDQKSFPGFRPHSRNMLITLAAEGGLTEEGKPFYNSALEIRAPGPKTLLACAYFMEKSGNLDEALNYYGGVVKAKPAKNIYEYACIRAGSVASRLSKHAAAAGYYSKWRDSSPDSVDPLVSLLEAYGDAGDIGGINSVYSEASERFRDEPLIHYNFGVIKMKMGAYEEAIKSFGKALALRPGLKEANYNIAKSLMSLSEKFEAHSAPWNQYMVEAISYHKKCIQQDPNFEPSHVSLGIIALGKNPPDYNSASECFAKALKINPASRDALLNMLALGYLKNEKATVEKYRNEITRLYRNDQAMIDRMNSYGSTKRLGE